MLPRNWRAMAVRANRQQQQRYRDKQAVSDPRRQRSGPRTNRHGNHRVMEEPRGVWPVVVDLREEDVVSGGQVAEGPRRAEKIESDASMAGAATKRSKNRPRSDPIIVRIQATMRTISIAHACAWPALGLHR